jgi:hypothetical protein
MLQMSSSQKLLNWCSKHILLLKKNIRIRHKLNNLDGLLKELKLYMNDHMKILENLFLSEN